MLKEYALMKKNEIKVKALFYKKLLSIIKEQENFMNLLNNLYSELKDIPVEELKDEVLLKTAQLLHREIQ